MNVLRVTVLHLLMLQWYAKVREFTAHNFSCTFYYHVCFTELSVPTSNCSNATLRIVDGPSHLEGRLEVCLNNVWGTVCESSWGNNNAAVACRQLGYQPTGEEYFTGTLVVFIGRYSSCLYFYIISQELPLQHHFMEVV